MPMDVQQMIFNHMVSEHVERIRYLHSVGVGGCFAIIFITDDDDAFGVGYNGDFNLLAASGENFLKKRLERPVKIPGLSGNGIRRISIGDHLGVALGARGLLYQWGLPFSKIRSCYDRSSIELPHPMAYMPHTVLKMGSGGGFFGVVTEHRKLFMWGYIDWSAPFSDGRMFSPIHKQVESISCGAWHMGMITSDGAVYTFGHGGYGQLGYDWCEDHGYWRVHKTSSNERCISMVLGSVSTMFVTESGELWACGLNHPQFGHLGVGNEEALIKKPVRIEIPEPISEISASYTLCNLRNVYAARSKDRSKIYAWGWGFESTLPQIYEGASSINEVFHYIATPSTIDDLFIFSKSSEANKLNASVEHAGTTETSETQADDTMGPFQRLRKNVHGLRLNLNLQDRRQPPRSKCSPTLSEQKNKGCRLNNAFTTKCGLSNHVCRLETVGIPVKNLLKKPFPEICENAAHKSYLDYVYSEGTKQLEFRELIEIYLLALHYGENQLVEHTFNKISNEVNEQNLADVLELSHIHHSDILKNLCHTFIKNLCKEPQKVVDLIMNLTINHQDDKDIPVIQNKNTKSSSHGA